MDLMTFIMGWFYYSFYYMLLAGFATLILNKVTKRLWLSPLIVNAVSALVLYWAVKNGWISGHRATYAMYFNYMPIVFTSVVINAMIGTKRLFFNRIKQYKEV